MFSQYPSGFRLDSNPSASATEDQSPNRVTRSTKSSRPSRASVRRRGIPSRGVPASESPVEVPEEEDPPAAAAGIWIFCLPWPEEQYGSRSLRSAASSERRVPRSSRPGGGSTARSSESGAHRRTMAGTRGTRCATGATFRTPPAPETVRKPRTRSTRDKGGEPDEEGDEEGDAVSAATPSNDDETHSEPSAPAATSSSSSGSSS